MTTPTANAVPSSAPQDLLFNAERLDQAMNSAAAGFTDRLGVSRLTLAGAMNRITVLNPRGAWATATAYNARDLVQSSSNWYICLDSHTSGGTFAGDQAAHWRLYQDSDFRSLEKQFGADPTGATDSSAAFAAAAAVHTRFYGTPGAIYKIKDVVLDSRQFIGEECIIRPASGARFVLKLKGWRPKACGFTLQDGDDYIHATTLSAGAASAATALVATSATGIEAEQVLLQDVDAAASWHLTAVASVAGSTINIRDSIPSAAASGRAMVAMFGAIWVEDALWWEASDVQVVNARGALLIKPSASGLSNYGTLFNFNVAGSRYFSILKQGNAAGVKAQNCKLWNGYNEVTNATGNGTAGPFTFSTSASAYLKRDLTVTVNGVAKTNPTHWTFTSGTSISFTSGNFPAGGAAIVMTHFRDSLRSFVDDQRSTSVISGGNNYTAIESLDAFWGFDLYECELSSYTDIIGDTCSFGAMQMSACAATVQINSAFLGYSQSSLKAFNSAPRIGRLYTARVPTVDTRSGTVDDNIYLDATSNMELDIAQWTGGDYQVNGPGKSNFKGGLCVDLISTPGTPISTVGAKSLSQTGDATSTQAWLPMACADSHLVEVLAACTAAPGVGETFTYQPQVGGVDQGTPFTISGSGVFSAVGRFAVSILKGQQFGCTVTKSAGAASAQHRVKMVVK